MQTTELRNIVFTILKSIAPEIEPAELDAAAPLRDQIDLDSMDYLNFIVGMHEKLKVEIPESDYQKLVSLDDIVSYLREKLPA
ncbi:MAG: acyl carrier protein [Burkholderiales bacterium]